jgi:hypothetical protein
MTAAAPIALPDPRSFPDARTASPVAAALYGRAESSLAADTGLRAECLDRELRAMLRARLAGDGATLATIIAGAPSVAIARHLWRLLDAAWREATQSGAGVTVTVFAIPLVVVAGLEGTSGEGALPGVLDEPHTLAAILREHGALAGNRTFALADALVAAGAIDVARLPEILAWQRLPDAPTEAPIGTAMPGGAFPARVLIPAPVALATGREEVSLRFLVGTAIAKPGVDLLADAAVGKWGVPFTQELGRQLGAGRASVLALPRAPQWLLPAVQQGRVAQREVSAQIFVSNALRRLRAAVGEPTAVISAHRAPGAPGGGELRLSLSSPFEPRDAEGFRCPLYQLDRVGDVAAMLVELLRDCRVTDIRLLAGVHPDRDAGTGLTLLFKPDTLADALTPLH